jgi:hypothetical protein
MKGSKFENLLDYFPFTVHNIHLTNIFLIRLKRLYQVLPRSVVPKHRSFLAHTGTSAILGLPKPGKPLKVPGGAKLRNKSESPLILPYTLINWFTAEQEWVFDLFAGTCTTAIAAYSLHRKFICVDVDQVMNKIQNCLLEIVYLTRNDSVGC